jgi:DNA (cytosine-5)-methyltransferase 1
LIQEELSGTLGVSQDQTLICLNDQGGQQMSVSEDKTATLRAAEHGHQPTVCMNAWDVQSKHIQSENGVAEALYSGDCRYGGGESYVMQENRAVAYGISPYESNAMKSNNPHSGIYEAETSRTLDLNGGSPACNQGGMMVVQGINGDIAGTLDASYYKGQGERQGIEREAVCVGNGQRAQARLSDKVGALNCMHDQQAVMVYGLDRASFNQGQNAQYDFSVEEDLAQTVLAKGPGGGTNETVGALCARDYKGVGSQYVDEGKVIVQPRNGR